MDLLAIVKQAWKLVWSNKYLWFFGFFVAGMGGGGGAPPKRASSAGGGSEALPSWLWPALGAAALVAVAALVLHVVSEGALIEAIRTRRGEQPFGLKAGFSTGLRHFWRVLGVKLLAALVVVVAVALAVAPLLLALFKQLPLWIGIPATALLALGCVPLLLTGYFLYEYALRFAVLQGAPAMDAYRAALGFLHGRLVPSLLLLLVSAGGSLAAGLAALVAALPGALVGTALYFAAGLVPALIAGLALFVPLLLPLAGALGTFRSAVWTLGFLDARQEA